jgi:hypothetical protein
MEVGEIIEMSPKILRVSPGGHLLVESSPDSSLALRVQNLSQHK